MAGNLEVTDLPLIPAVDGADVYAAKNNLDYRVRTGEAGGLATLDGTGRLPATQVPATIGSITISGVVTYSGSGSVWRADMSSAPGTRTNWQTTVTNGGTLLDAVPNGSSTTSGFVAFNSSTPANSGYAAWRVTGNTAFVDLNKVGSGTSPTSLQIQYEGVTRFTVESTGNTSVAGTTLSVRNPSAGPNGFTQLNSGTNINPGYISFHTPDGTRRGFVGWAAASSNTLSGDNGWDWTCTTTFTTAQTMTSNGDVAFRIGTSAFAYFECLSPHLAYYKKNSGGATNWYWRRNDTGTVGGANEVQCMTLTDAGNLAVAGNVNCVNVVASSDENLKYNIHQIKARERLPHLLRFVEFMWRSNDQKDKGVIAQQVRDVAPEYVYETEDGTLAVDKASLALECVISLAQELKELKERV